MSELASEDRLTVPRSYVKRLEYDASGAAEEHARIRRHLDAVRAAEASAAAAARGAQDRFEDALEDLGTRLAIARHRLAAELTDDRRLFERAVEAELRDWDAYLERLQKRAAKDGRADEQSQLAIADLRTRYDEAAGRLREMQAAPDEIWRERRERVEAALHELERAMDKRTAPAMES
jgi:chromosome segregation ATPase